MLVDASVGVHLLQFGVKTVTDAALLLNVPSYAHQERMGGPGLAWERDC